MRRFAECVLILVCACPRAAAQDSQVESPVATEFRPTAVSETSEAKAETSSLLAARLEEKLAELSSLQAEVDKLRRETKCVPQVLIALKIFDIDVNKARNFVPEVNVNPAQPPGLKELLEKIAPKEDAAGTAAVGDSPIMVLPPQNAFLAALQELRREGIATVICEPNLTAYSRAPASFASGGEFAVAPSQDGKPPTYKRFGTLVDFVAVVRAGGEMHIDIRAQVSEIDPSRTIKFAGFTLPGLRLFEVATAFDARPGETLVLSTVQQRKVEAPVLEGVPGARFFPGANVPRKGRDTLRLVLVTPQLVDPGAAAPAAASDEGGSASEDRQARHEKMRAQRDELLDKVDAPRRALQR